MGNSAKGGKGVAAVGTGGMGMSVAVGRAREAVAVGVLASKSVGTAVSLGAGAIAWQPTRSLASNAISKILWAWDNKRCKIAEILHILTS